MSEQATPLEINAPSLPKGGGAIQSIGKGWEAIGTGGGAALNLALPISPGRGFAPALGLGYSSGVGNSLFGIGFSLTVNAISRRTSKGVPGYGDDDQIVGPSDDAWMPERNDSTGAIISRTETQYNGVAVGTCTVVRYQPRTEGAFDLIEHWSTASDAPGFWLIHGADGSLHCYGKTAASRRADPLQPDHVGVWLLDESMNNHGEHIAYEYKAETKTNPAQFRDYTAQRYLSKVLYGNASASADLFSWSAGGWKDQQWHFHLVFDYGERDVGLEQLPTYAESRAWLERSDPFSTFAYGFELSTQRLCQQVLMFHSFPLETDMGATPVLVQRLLLQYRPTSLGYNQLRAAHSQAFAKGKTPLTPNMQSRPPVEFTYSPFELKADNSGFTPFDQMPGLNEGESYQLVDLEGEGLPGVLYRDNHNKGWYYREPSRAQAPAFPDQVAYDQWALLPKVPVGEKYGEARQALVDLDGDSRLEFFIAKPGMHGRFIRQPDRTWGNFVAEGALPLEYFSPMAQMADLMGDGLSDLVMIGPRSVRLYANRRAEGFAHGQNIPHQEDDDRLPLLSNSPAELVAFSDVLGSGQQHLIRIRHNQIKCWPNLGRGRFGKGFVFAELDFAYAEFDASRVLLTDLDGSGATDLIYLTTDHARIYMNRCGTGLQTTPVQMPWPQGVRYDRLCQASSADLQGLGCANLILTVPHMSPRHWRCDLVSTKPYLLQSSNNNMGASGRINYRSSAQEWLDEKQQRRQLGQPVDCYLPFPVQVVSQQTQLDEITGNQLSQRLRYRQGYYDALEREFRGFRLLLATDTDAPAISVREAGHTAPVLTKTWFHTGFPNGLIASGYYSGDSQAQALGEHLYSRYHHADLADQIIETPSPEQARQMLLGLSGSTVRVEVFAADDDPLTAVPYSVVHNRYLVRELRALNAFQPYAVVQTFPLESITYQYEGDADDPICEHTLNLRWDKYGSLTHGVSVAYARRKTAGSDPACSLAVADITPEKRWWCDAHDEQQQFYYLSETRAENIHDLGEPTVDRQHWLPSLPYRQRANALVLKKGAAPDGLTPAIISWETFVQTTPNNPLGDNAKRVLVAQTVQRYRDPLPLGNENPLPEGKAHFAGLSAYVESAELDETALGAYDRLKDASGQMPFNLKEKLAELGYQKMKLFLPDNPVEDARDNLWSVRRGFAVYGALASFYNVLRFRATLSHGTTHIAYDPYYLTRASVTLPDGCTTRVEAIDYRTLLAARIVDPNQNTQEACYGAFGQVLASTFYGTEFHDDKETAVGFAPIADYTRPEDDSPTFAIENQKLSLQDAASASFEDAFSWMAKVNMTAPLDPAWLADGDLLPSGHICASARERLARLTTLNASEKRLHALIASAEREPVHAATLQADRYPGDPALQYRISIACWDGFGRALQTKQEVEQGEAYVVLPDGSLKLGTDGKPVLAAANRRWRVSERVEYNNKGLPICVYRPYFADQPRHINDASFRQHGYHDRQFYDALGRPTETWLANGWMKRMTYCNWYVINEDENDTQQEVEAGRTVA